MKQLGLIGFPLSHSFSKEFFKRKFNEESIEEWLYDLFPMETLGQLRELIWTKPHLVGLNVTIPFKIQVMEYLDYISPEANVIGAVNTIKIERESGQFKLYGHNTDVYGFKNSLVTFLSGAKPRALVLGSGGAAKAVEYVLRQLGIVYRVVSRSPGDNMYSYEQINKQVINDHQLIINTTPLGMYPNDTTFPDIPYEFLTPKHFLYDLVYNPAETSFLKMGQKAGASIKNGLEMLELQAEKSWEIWTSLSQ